MEDIPVKLKIHYVINVLLSISALVIKTTINMYIYVFFTNTMTKRGG